MFLTKKHSKVGYLAFNTTSSGGVYQYTLAQLKALSMIPEIDLVVFSDSDGIKNKFMSLDFRSISVRSPLWMRILRWLSFFLPIPQKFLLDSGTREQVHDIDFFISPIIAVFPHYFCKKPFAYTLHDFQYRYLQSFFSLRKRITRWILDRVLSDAASLIFCEANSVKADIVKFLGMPESKIKVVMAPPALAEIPLDLGNSENASKALSFAGKKFLFYPAQMWPHKNHIRLLEAFRNLRNQGFTIEMVFTGAPNTASPAIEKYISDHHLNEYVHVLGFVDDHLMVDLFRSAYCVVVPSLFESISIPIFEAFRHGTPVCAAAIQGIPDQVGDAALLFDPFNVASMQQAIQQLLEDAAFRDALGKKGLVRMREFTFSKYQKDVEGALKDYIG